MEWSEGYVTEIGYEFNYFSELSPAILRVECLAAGLTPPATTPLRYLELGFGQGVTINVHAAAAQDEFWGTDFNPTHTGFARALAAASGSGAVLLNDSFAELADKSDLPEFDVIALHGIWSWVSGENRRIILDIIRRKLKIGGLVYISYNCLPGGAVGVPLRHLMKLYSDLACSEVVGMIGRVDAARKFAQQVADVGAIYFRRTPGAARRLKEIATANPQYLAHEYFTRDLHLMAFSDVARELESAKLTFATSGTVLNHIDAINLTNDQIKFLAEIKHPVMRQSVRDYIVNEQFRRDIFVKGPRWLSELDRLEILRKEMFVIIKHPDDISMKIEGSLGESGLQETLYRPLIEILAEEDYAPKTVGFLEQHEKLKSIHVVRLFQALLVLIGGNHVRPAQAVNTKARAACAALNRYLCELARNDGNIEILASPVSGCGIPVSRVDQLFILASRHGKETISEKVAYVWELLSARGQSLVKEGKSLQTSDENIAVLTEEITKFVERRLPILKALSVA